METKNCIERYDSVNLLSLFCLFLLDFCFIIKHFKFVFIRLLKCTLIDTFIKTLLNKIYLQKWIAYNFLDKVLRAYILIFRVKHEKGYAICGLSWHPTCGQIAYTDAEGNLGLLENVCDPSGKMSNSKVISNRVEQFLQSFCGRMSLGNTANQVTFFENYNLCF